MANFDMYFSDKEREEAEAAEMANVTPIVCGNPSDEEAEKAFEEMFAEAEEKFNKLFKEVWKK